MKISVVKIALTLMCTIKLLACYAQSCDTGKLDARVEKSLSKIGDLHPILNRTSIEQAKQDKLDHQELYPERDVHVVKITADSISIYVFNATNDKNLPTILYFHPGGFVTPFLPFMKYDCWKMSGDLHAVVFAVDYRIAPEHKFPAAVKDAYRAFTWVLDNANAHGGDPSRLVVSGHSAGANLSAVLCHKAKDNGLGSKIKLQILNCPSVDNIKHHAKYPSYQKYAAGYFQTQQFIVFAQKLYGDERDFDNPEFAPLLAKSFEGLPPAIMITTEFDILRDEDMAYVQRLREAKVKVWHHCFSGQIHCLVGLQPEDNEFRVLNNLIKEAMVEVF